ncbi:Protein of uncharacterised function (DUF1684) [Actinobaculum suis]|uniref:Protein of uncharacterized function (DUF1684) n=2 Tax=Actinobaculum suis TaxID=1657 RepID=A0A7Z9C8X5_9ACTO|nr:Protein of uncharacterised function (DUF1684) [Actinobaculum suis]
MDAYEYNPDSTFPQIGRDDWAACHNYNVSMENTGSHIPQDTEAITKWQAWHQRRKQELAAPHGWLSLISFTWLNSHPRTVRGFPGTFHEVDGHVLAQFDPAEGVRRGGVVVAEASIVTAEDDSDLTLHWQDRIAEVGMRGGRYMVRIRDPHAPTRTGFAGVPVFAYDPNAVVTARFTAFPAPREVEISTAREGLRGTAHLVGEVTFRYDAAAHRLAVQGDPDGVLTAVFSDATSGQETDAWRFVSFPGPGLPKKDSAAQFATTRTGEVKIDFNRALNFPMAFSDFATCPAPPDGNHLQVAIRAGEKAAR